MDAERPVLRSHAEHGNEKTYETLNPKMTRIRFKRFEGPDSQ